MRGEITLAVDCGGGGIKVSVLDWRGTMLTKPVRIPTPYPLGPAKLVETIAEQHAQLPPSTRVTVGMPGMIRHGVVVYTPHYINVGGPRTRVDPELERQWRSFDMRAALSARLGIPCLVLNDAEVHGAGVVSGKGLEIMLTFGTGLGFALFDGGSLAPHLELSHAPVKWGLTYDDYLGEHERLRLGDAHWSRRVRKAIDGLYPMFRWDRLYVGGGNSRRIRPSVVAKLGENTVIVPNTAGVIGGVRAWELT